MRILVVEDDFDLGEGIVEALETKGHSVEWMRDGEDGFYRAAEWPWDLVILDRMLPNLDGTTIAQRLRAKQNTPILMLTALNTVDHRIEGFDSGADDYLGKPFELRELLARVSALARRSYKVQASEIRYGDLQLDPESKRGLLSGVDLSLTYSEYRTLEFMILRKGKVVTRRQLEDVIADDGRELMPNALDVHMHRIRQKIGKRFIQTQRGLGYRIPDDGADA